MDPSLFRSDVLTRAISHANTRDKTCKSMQYLMQLWSHYNVNGRGESWELLRKNLSHHRKMLLFGAIYPQYLSFKKSLGSTLSGKSNDAIDSLLGLATSFSIMAYSFHDHCVWLAKSKAFPKMDAARWGRKASNLLLIYSFLNGIKTYRKQGTRDSKEYMLDCCRSLCDTLCCFRFDNDILYLKSMHRGLHGCLGLISSLIALRKELVAAKKALKN